jgi:hypothetical protein
VECYINPTSREDTMFHNVRLPSCIAAIFLLAPVTAGTAAEIKVLNANALTVAMKQLAADFTKETGNQVSFVGVSPGLVEQRIKAGETYDLVITATASAEAFEKEGRWRAGTRRPGSGSESRSATASRSTSRASSPLAKRCSMPRPSPIAHPAAAA